MVSLKEDRELRLLCIEFAKKFAADEGDLIRIAALFEDYIVWGVGGNEDAVAASFDQLRQELAQ